MLEGSFYFIAEIFNSYLLIKTSKVFPKLLSNVNFESFEFLNLILVLSKKNKYQLDLLLLITHIDLGIRIKVS